MAGGAKRTKAVVAEVVAIGCGAIGLPFATAMASTGQRVVGVDIDRALIAGLAAGRGDHRDPGLGEALRAGLADGRLTFSDEIGPADHIRAYVVAVPTPAATDGGFDRTALAHAMSALAAAAQPGELVCIRSTVPIGATRVLSGAAGRADLAFAACPDRSIAGNAFAEQFSVPHVIGGLTEAAGEAAEALFARLGRVIRTPDPETAEAIKLFANAQRDVSFALANQLAFVCEAAGIDFATVSRAGAESYPRFAVARPGPVGGPCLGKDLALLLASRGADALDASLLLAARRLNESLPGRIAARIAEELTAADRAAPRVAVLGLAFKGKPPTPDQRGAFASALIEALEAVRPGLEITRWDPVSDPAPARRAAVEGATVVVLANDHPALALDLAADLAEGAVVFDMTGVLGSNVSGDVRRLGDGRRRREP